MTPYEIPLISSNQTFQINLAGVDYGIRVLFNSVLASWVMDLFDTNDALLLGGIPLVTGSDLLGQYPYLEVGGMFIVQTDFDANAVPTFTNLGKQSHLYFVVTP